METWPRWAEGAARWSRKLPEGAESLWVAPDGAVFLATTDGGTRVPPDGKQELPFTWPTPQSASAAFDGRGRLYVPTMGEIWVYSNQGEKERACKAKIFGFSETIVGLPDEGFIYPDMEGDLVAVSPECQEIWRYTAAGSKPSTGWGWRTVAAAGDGSVFAARANGEIHACWMRQGSCAGVRPRARTWDFIFSPDQTGSFSRPAQPESWLLLTATDSRSGHAHRIMPEAPAHWR